MEDTENTSDSLPIPPWKLQEERKMDIKPDASDEEIIKEKNQQSQKGNTSIKQLKRIGVLSLAKAYAVIGLTIGLVIALVYGIISDTNIWEHPYFCNSGNLCRTWLLIWSHFCART